MYSRCDSFELDRKLLHNSLQLEVLTWSGTCCLTDLYFYVPYVLENITSTAMIVSNAEETIPTLDKSNISSNTDVADKFIAVGVLL